MAAWWATCPSRSRSTSSSAWSAGSSPCRPPPARRSNRKSAGGRSPCFGEHPPGIRGEQRPERIAALAERLRRTLLPVHDRRHQAHRAAAILRGSRRLQQRATRRRHVVYDRHAPAGAEQGATVRAIRFGDQILLAVVLLRGPHDEG